MLQPDETWDGSHPEEPWTHGQPYVFLLMKFASQQPLCDLIRETIEERLDVPCYRADEVKKDGESLLDKIHRLIEGADAVVALITDPSANVMYEIGYAVAVKKPPILLIDRNAKVPANLEGLVMVKYDLSSDAGKRIFQEDLVDRVQARLEAKVFLFRNMLHGPVQTPAYVVASPKYPTDASILKGQPRDLRTFGDNLGIRGLFSAFGVTLGDPKGVELISAQHADPKAIKSAVNLYLIGSRKVNPVTEEMLPRLIDDYYFDPHPDYEETDDFDWPCVLYKSVCGEAKPLIGGLRPEEQGKYQMWQEDYGILVRGPHPDHPDDRIVMIMAGGHSLGTGAACLAATQPALIRRIDRILPPGTLADKYATFSVLIKGTASETDGLLDPEGCDILEARVYD